MLKIAGAPLFAGAHHTLFFSSRQPFWSCGWMVLWLDDCASLDMVLQSQILHCVHVSGHSAISDCITAPNLQGPAA